MIKDMCAGGVRNESETRGRTRRRPRSMRSSCAPPNAARARTTGSARVHLGRTSSAGSLRASLVTLGFQQVVATVGNSRYYSSG